MSYIVSTSLPLPPSCSLVAEEDYKVNNRFRNYLAKRMGVKFKLVGMYTATPYYAVNLEFKSSIVAQAMADNIAYEIRHAIAEDRVRFNHPKLASEALIKPVSVFEWKQDRPFWK